MKDRTLALNLLRVWSKSGQEPLELADSAYNYRVVVWFSFEKSPELANARAEDLNEVLRDTGATAKGATTLDRTPKYAVLAYDLTADARRRLMEKFGIRSEKRGSEWVFR